MPVSTRCRKGIPTRNVSLADPMISQFQNAVALTCSIMSLHQLSPSVFFTVVLSLFQDLIIDAIYADIIHGKLDQKNKQVCFCFCFCCFVFFFFGGGGGKGRVLSSKAKNLERSMTLNRNFHRGRVGGL